MRPQIAVFEIDRDDGDVFVHIRKVGEIELGEGERLWSVLGTVQQNLSDLANTVAWMLDRIGQADVPPKVPDIYLGGFFDLALQKAYCLQIRFKLAIKSDKGCYGPFQAETLDLGRYARGNFAPGAKGCLDLCHSVVESVDSDRGGASLNITDRHVERFWFKKSKKVILSDQAWMAFFGFSFISQLVILIYGPDKQWVITKLTAEIATCRADTEDI